MFFRAIKLIDGNNELFGGLRCFKNLSKRELLILISYIAALTLLFFVILLESQSHLVNRNSKASFR